MSSLAVAFALKKRNFFSGCLTDEAAPSAGLSAHGHALLMSCSFSQPGSPLVPGSTPGPKDREKGLPDALADYMGRKTGDAGNWVKSGL